MVCTLTGAEIAAADAALHRDRSGCRAARFKDYPLAVSKVRYQGEPVVAVVAESPGIGR